VNLFEQHITNKIKERVKQRNPLAQVILYGSHARGQSDRNSDWDILILLNDEYVSRSVEREYRDALFDIELEIGQAISTFVFSKNEWEKKHVSTPFYQNVKREGINLL